jgi:hypothetical protein
VVLSNGVGPCGSEQGAEENTDIRLTLFEVGLTDSGRESVMVTMASVLLSSHSRTLR